MIPFVFETFLLMTQVHAYTEFLELGHELFRATSNSYPGCFFPGDVFDPEFLSIAAQRPAEQHLFIPNYRFVLTEFPQSPSWPHWRNQCYQAFPSLH